jgi:hypothetical protein
MGARFTSVIAGTGVVVVAAMASPAFANYQIRTLTNNTDQIAAISFPVGPGGRSSSTFVNGDMVVAIPGKGIVIFRDQGHNTPCSRPYWGVSIKYNDQQWGFFYDGGGTIDMTINADGSLAFVAGPAGVIVNGSGPPQCTQF